MRRILRDESLQRSAEITLICLKFVFYPIDKKGMRTYKIKVFPYVPSQVLKNIAGESSPELLARMRRFRMNIVGLAAVTCLDVSSVKDLVFGRVPPISRRGSWTKVAIKVSNALLARPEDLFPKVIDQIGVALTSPDQEIFPGSLVPELNPSKELRTIK